MNIEKFANQIEKANRNSKIKKIIAYLVLLAFGFVFSGLGNYNDIWFFVVGECILVVNAMEVGRYKWNQYLYYYEDEGAMAFRHPLSEVMRTQAFPMKEYFSYVSKKMYVLAILLGVTNSLFGMIIAMRTEESRFEWSRFGVALVFSVICALSPWMVGMGKKWFWSYQCKMGTTGKLNMLLKIIKVLFVFVEYLYAIVAAVLGTLFLYGITMEHLMPPMDETRVTLRSCPFLYAFILILVLEVAVVFWLFNSDSKKRTSKIIGIGIGCGILAAVGLIFVEVNSYTDVSEDQIVVHKLWDEEVYLLDEVEHFAIYEANESIQMKLYFENGKTTKIIGSSLDSSKLYDQTYFSEYNFIADYILQLKEAGATGTLEDVKQLRKDVVDLDPEILRGLEKIIEEMK